MSLRPLTNHLIVSRLDGKKESKGGILLPDASQEKPSVGIVVAVGPGKKVDGQLEAVGVDAGDTILFHKFAGQEYDLNGEKVVVLTADEVLAVVEVKGKK